MSRQTNFNSVSCNVLCLFILSLLILFPNLGFIILLVFIILFGVKTRLFFDLFIILTIIIFSSILASKNVTGEGNDYVTYYSNIVNGLYPEMKENFFDFLFWQVAGIILPLVSQKDTFQFFFIINILSFTPYYFIFKIISYKLGTDTSSKIIAMYLIMTLSSLSFWNLYGNYIRQAWSFTFFLLAIIYINDKKLIHFSVLALLSITSHSSGSIFIFFLVTAYIVSKFNVNKIMWLIIIVATFSLIMSPLSILARFLPVHISSKIDFYKTWSGSDFGKVAVVRLYVLFLISFILHRLSDFKEHKIYKLYVLLLISSCIFVLASSVMSDVSKIVERLYYPSVLLMFLVTSIQIHFISAAKENNSNRALILTAVIIGSMVLLPYSLYSSLYYNPYFYNGSVYDFLFSNSWQ